MTEVSSEPKVVETSARHSEDGSTNPTWKLNEDENNCLDVYQNPEGAVSPEESAITPNVVQSKGSPTHDTGAIGDRGIHSPEVHQDDLQPQLRSEVSFTSTGATDPPLSSDMEHFGGTPTTNVQESGVERKNPSDVSSTFETVAKSETPPPPPPSLQNLKSHCPPPPTASTNAHVTPKSDDLPAGTKLSAEVIPTTKSEFSLQVSKSPPINPIAPANRGNNKAAIDIKPLQEDDKSKPQSGGQESGEEILSFKERLKLFEQRCTTSHPQFAVKAPSADGVKSSHQLNEMKQSVDEKSNEGSKIAPQRTTVTATASTKTSSSSPKSAPRKDEHSEVQDSDSDSDSDDDDDSDSDSTTSDSGDNDKEDKEEEEKERMMRF
ncbi:unnamed protein product [Hydatigera taeniaeformis]|uniref:CAP-ZIP_m domain-containing protein n=1 Tax=Hydatigena taeniaeformis TaxID=6205 RepID=A0A0R3WXG5_HYDTA|nr:unnamed protein product [Hydatigera taeniaeformis]